MRKVLIFTVLLSVLLFFNRISYAEMSVEKIVDKANKVAYYEGNDGRANNTDDKAPIIIPDISKIKYSLKIIVNTCFKVYPVDISKAISFLRSSKLRANKMARPIVPSNRPKLPSIRNILR